MKKTVQVDLTANEKRVPAFGGNVDFHANHSPMGAYMSFTAGHFNAAGGIGVELGRPAGQNIYVGVKRGDRRSRQPLACLPFFKSAVSPTSAAAAFEVGQATNKQPPGVQSIAPDQIRRHYGWGSDQWVTPQFEFTLYSPFGEIPDPAVANVESMRSALLPAIVGTLRVDNRSGAETLTGVFAIDFIDPGARLLNLGKDQSAAPRLGFAWKRKLGVAGMIQGGGDDSLFAIQRWSVAEGIADVNHVHALGTIGGLAFEVPPGEIRVLHLAIGVYLDGVVTTGLEGRYQYTRYYTGLEQVLSTALDRSAELRAKARNLDAQLLSSKLSPDQQFLIAHATRSYYANTQLLDIGGEPMFIVNEGEYCMMNTLDLSIDQAFWELDRNPWVVRNILDSFARDYSYIDQVKSRTNELRPGGISFTHDIGVNNNFSAPGTSSYELRELKGCFSFMTQEQLCNWILLAGCYVAKTNDLKWLAENAHLIESCATSMRARANQRTGVMAYDSDRCGSGSEITTYDSLDESLGQARANTYIAVKCWASWLALDMLRHMQKESPADSLADNIAAHLSAAAVDGVIPAVLEKDNPGYLSRILPVAESLIYPAYWLACLSSQHEDARDALRSALHSQFIDVIARHTKALLLDPQKRNLFPDGGIRLSSTSNNSWMSKIALFQHVTRNVLKLCDTEPKISQLFTAADSAHVRWQTDGSAAWACSDQIVDGVARGSRYYPRIVTAALWMDETTASTQTPVEESLPAQIP